MICVVPFLKNGLGELARQSNENDGLSTLRKEIEHCQGNSYLFKVSSYQGNGSGRVFNIAQLCSDPDIINEHKPTHDDSSSYESDSDDNLDKIIPKTKQAYSNVPTKLVIEIDRELANTPSSTRHFEEYDDGSVVVQTRNPQATRSSRT